MLSTFNAYLVLIIIQCFLLKVKSSSGSGMLVITQSGTSTIITSPSPSVNATIAANSFSRNITQNPAAKWIWYGPGNDVSCPMQITVTQSFNMKCLNKPLNFYVAADSSYTATIGNYTFTGNDSPNSYTLSTTGLACDTQFSWTIVATNSGTTNCSNNPAGLIFSILSADCPCTSSQYAYDSQTCGCSVCFKTLVGCASCNSSTYCQNCNSSRNFISSPSNGACIPKSGFHIIEGCICASNTSQCPNTKECGCNTQGNFVMVSGKCVCSSGYVVNGDHCQSCSSFISSCAECNSTTSCNICINGYTLLNYVCKNCVSLMSNCKTCSSSTVCTTCVSTSYAVQNNICVNCGSIMTGCLTCSSSSVCLTCDTANYFYLDSNVCKCNSGYALNGLNCQYCNITLTNCVSCSSTTVCSQCQNTSYTVNNSVCTLCSILNSICLTCTSPSYCTTCDTTQNYNPTAVLGICKCQSGYTLDSGSCTLCSSLINGCSTCSSSTVCTTCVSTSYAVQNNICVNCGSIMTGCLTCSSSSVCLTCDTANYFYLDSNVCKCNSGYALNGLNCQYCNITLTNCVSCSSTTVCSQCQNTSYTVNNSVCTLCSILNSICLTCTSPSYCSTCDTTQNYNPTAVLGICKCQSGYTLDSGSCTLCSSLINGCSTCSSSTVCTTCVSTSYAVQNNICVNCGSIMTGCLTCSSSSVCLTCDTANYFYLDSNVCKCNSGYALNGLNCQYCNITLTNCVSCSSTTVCSQCQNTSYTVNNSVCTLCSILNSICLTCTSPSYCSTCDITQNYNSTAVLGICKCQSGYTLILDSCVLNSLLLNGCNIYSTLTVCASCDNSLNFNSTPNSASTCDCASTYVFDSNNHCVLCNLTLNNCSTCISQSICSCCNNNYTLDNTGVCISCYSILIGCSSCNLTNCLSCDSAKGLYTNLDGNGKIISCKCINDSYYFDGNTCNFCNPQFAGCSECQILTSNPLSLNCSQCLDSYYSTLTSTVITSCSACSTISAGCITCSTGPICNTCDATLFYNPTPNSNTCDCMNSSYVKMPSNNCVACNTISALGSCSQCLSTTVCTACINNAYAIDINNVCTACSTLITGCLTCDSSTNCLTCDLTDYVPSGLNPNTCICNSISTMNNSVCTLCSSLISNCITCSNYQTCTTCISLYTNSSGNCVLCSSIIALGPCINCSSTTTCTLCQANYFPDNTGVCRPCSYYMTNCTTCSSNNTCLTCDTGFGLEPNNNILCSPCSTFMIGCLQCTSSQTCTKCDFNGFFVKNSNNSCRCVDSLVNYNSICTACSQPLSNCISCKSSTICTACSVGYYVNHNNNCQVCTYGCLVCNLTNGCSHCDPTLTASLVIDANNYGHCGCPTGYVLNTADPNNNYCQSICGDGYLISPDEQCDDNNLINGDGCSSLCVVQTNYTCTNNPLDLSVCSYNQPLSIAIQSIVKQPNSNTLTFTMQIGPNISSLNSVNFSNIISSNVSLSNPIYTYSPNGTLTISYNYNTTLQGQPAQFTIDPTLAGSNFSQSSPSNLTVNLVSSNNLPIAFYNQSVYDDSKKYKDAYLAAQVISYIILAAGMSCNKIVGVQLFGALQVAFFSVSTINQVQPLLQPIRQLKTVNGINSQFNFNSSSVPDRVKGIGYQAPFLSNFNYMFWLVIGQIFTGVSFIIAGKLISSFSQKLEKIGKKMLKEYLLMLALFNILNISYSAGLQFTYDDTLFSTNSAIAVLAMVVPVVIGLVYTFSPADNDDFGQFKSYFKPNYVCKSYFLFTIVYRAILGICMSQMNEIEQATIITFIISMFYFMFLISNLPFKKGYQNYRTVICQISVMISLFISMYYRSMKSTTDPSISSQILSPAFLQMLGIFSSVTVSLMCLCYQIYLKYLKPSLQAPELKQEPPTLNKKETKESNMTINTTQQNMDSSVNENTMQQYIQ